MQQVDGAFSKSRRSGYKENVKTWGQLGLTGDWASRPVSLFGRNSASGTYGFFKEHVLKNGDYKDEVKEQPGSASVVQGVTVDRFAMGYSGIGYATAGVKALPLAAKQGDKCHPATPEEAYSGNYPLARFLYVYVNRAPGQAARPDRRRVPQAGPLEGRAGSRRQGRLLPAAVEDRAGRARQAPQVGRGRHVLHARERVRGRAGGAAGPKGCRPAARPPVPRRPARRPVRHALGRRHHRRHPGDPLRHRGGGLAAPQAVFGRRSVPAGALPAGTVPLALAVDEYREEAFVATKGGLLVLPVSGGEATVAELPGARRGHGRQGRRAGAGADRPRTLRRPPLSRSSVSTEVAYEDGKRRVTPSVRPGSPVTVDTEGKPAGVFKYVRGPDGPIALVATGPRELTLVRVVEKTNLMGETTREDVRIVLPVEAKGEVTSLALDVRGQDIFAGTSGGRDRPVRPPRRGRTRSRRRPSPPARRERRSTVLGFLNGDRTLVSGDAAGRVSSWQVIQAEAGDSRRLARIHEFRPHGAAVTGFSASRRDKGFVTGDAAGGVEVHYATTGKSLLSLEAGKAPLGAVVFAPKADAVLAASADGRLHQFTLRNPHPEVSWNGALREGLVRGVRQARLRLAVDRRNRRLRGQVQPDASHLRDAQGDVLRPHPRDPARPRRRSLHLAVHAPEPAGPSSSRSSR